MNVDIKGVHLAVSDRVRAYVAKKLERLDFAKELITDLLLILGKDGTRYQLEATVNCRWGASTHVEVNGFRLYEDIDALFDKLEPTIGREKEKLQEHHKRPAEKE